MVTDRVGGPSNGTDWAWTLFGVTVTELETEDDDEEELEFFRVLVVS